MFYKLEYRPGDGTCIAPDAQWWVCEWDEAWDDEHGSHWMPLCGFRDSNIAVGYVSALNDEHRVYHSGEVVA